MSTAPAAALLIARSVEDPQKSEQKTGAFIGEHDDHLAHHCGSRLKSGGENMYEFNMIQYVSSFLPSKLPTNRMVPFSTHMLIAHTVGL